MRGKRWIGFVRCCRAEGGEEGVKGGGEGYDECSYCLYREGL